MVVGGDAQPKQARRRRRPWGWGLFAVAVLGLRMSALGGEPPVAGADAPATGAQEDGDPLATTRLSWVVGGSDPLVAGEQARACVDAGPGCSADGMLAVDTTRARAGALASALAVATDPAGEGYLGEPAAAVAARADATHRAAAQVTDVLARWLGAGCGSSVDGVPVETRAPECPAVGEEARAALDLLERSLQEWAA